MADWPQSEQDPLALAAVHEEEVRAQAAETTESSARAAADTQASADLAAEVLARGQDVDDEMTRAEAAEAAEVTARSAAVSAEQARAIAAEAAEATARAQAVTGEATARDSAISAATAAEVTARNNAVAAEASARTAADTAEQAARVAADALAQPKAEKNKASGYAGLDSHAAIRQLALPKRAARDPLAESSRLYVRNDFANPRGVGANVPAGAAGWAAAAGNGAGTVSSLTMTPFTGDPDIGDGVEVTAVVTGGAKTVNVFTGSPVATFGVPLMQNQVAYMGIVAKLTARPAGNADLPLWVGAFQTKGDAATVTTNRTVRKVPRLLVNAPTLCEGFDVGAPLTGFICPQYTLFFPGAGTWTVRFAQPMIVVDPDTDVPVYVDGTKWWASWTGAANASPSEGWADPPVPPAGFHQSIGSPQIWNTPVPMSNRQASLLVQELGAHDHVRFGMEQTTMLAVQANAGDTIDWRRTIYGGLLDELRDAGLKAFPGIGQPTLWMTNNNGAGGASWLKDIPPSSYAAWAALYVNMVTEWADVIDRVEFWNEPNLVQFWAPNGPVANPDPAKFADLQKYLYTAIKAARPDIVFVSAGLSTAAGGTINNQQMDAAAFLQGMYDAGFKGYTDHIGVHPYPGDPSTAAPVASSAMLGFDAGLESLRAVRHANGDDATPLDITEIGASIAANVINAAAFTDRQSAQALLLMRGIARRSGDIKGYSVHQLTGDVTMPAAARNSYGLVDFPSMRRRASFEALKHGRLPSSGWRTLPLSNSWTTYVTPPTGNSEPPVEYRWDPVTNLVHIRGAVKNGATATSAIVAANVLPQWLRPRRDSDITAIQNNAGTNTPAIVRIYRGGQISPVANSSTTYLRFEGFFEAEGFFS